MGMVMKNLFRPRLFIQLLVGSILTAAVTVGVGAFILLVTARIENRTEVIVNRLTPILILAASFEKNIHLSLVASTASSTQEAVLRTQRVSERTALINGLDLIALHVETETGTEISSALSRSLDELKADIARHEAGGTESEPVRHSEMLQGMLTLAQGLTAFINARYIGEEFELQSDTNSLRQMWIATFSILIVFGVLSAVYFSRRLARRVSKMLRGAREFTRGNFDYKIGSASRDELGELANQMDSMAAKLAVLTSSVKMLKTELISTTSHQLLTPLTRVRWTLNELQDEFGNATDATKERFKTLNMITVQMIQFVLLILDASKLEGEGMYYAIRPTPIGTMLQPIIEDAAVRAAENNIRFIASPVDSSIVIAADTGYLPAAFQNLIDNALRYTPSGKSITLRVEQKGTTAVVSIADTVIGIPEKDKDNIFRKFFRAYNAQKMINVGNGLGLYISKTIVTGHGGTISFQSKEGEGTTFTVVLPLAENTK